MLGVMLLDVLFGNATAEKVLLFIAVNEDAYAQRMSEALGVPLSVIQKQLRRLENGGVLVSRLVGRTRLFSLNPRYPLRNELQALLKRAFSLLPSEQQALYESVRTRPRLTGKPLRSSHQDEDEATPE